MEKTKNKKEKGVITAEEVIESLKGLEIGRSKVEQIRAILCIAVTNKVTLLPFICKIISEQSSHYYAECAEYFCNELSLSDEECIRTHLMPEIKEFIESLTDMSNDYEICQTIDRKFTLSHPKEKIAYLYKMAKLGSTYAQLSAGSRMSMLDEDPDFLFDMPLISRNILKKGIKSLKDKDSIDIKNIKSSMKSLIIESHVKYIKSSLDCGYNIVELIDEVTWLTTNSPNHHRWVKLISKTKELSEIFHSSAT
jgi:hypothetical protein